MKDCSHCTVEVCPETRETLETVSIEVSPNHPLLQLKRALPWVALFEVMSRHWREAGKNGHCSKDSGSRASPARLV